MDPRKDMPGESTCTTCQFSEDFSNYWTAILYFRARNGSYKRVTQLGNNQFEHANGGLTVYYMQDAIYDKAQKSKVTAFQPVSSKIKPSCCKSIMDSLKIGVSYVCWGYLRQDFGRCFPLSPTDVHLYGHLGHSLSRKHEISYPPLQGGNHDHSPLSDLLGR